MAKWSLFKKLRVPTTPKGPRTVNIVFGYFFVINYIIGTGFLGIPYSFYHAGMLTSIATLCVVSFLVWSTASWLLEVMARAQVNPNDSFHVATCLPPLLPPPLPSPPPPFSFSHLPSLSFPSL